MVIPTKAVNEAGVKRMVYYTDHAITIRTIEDSDAKIICREEIVQGWNATEEKYLTRIADHAAGRCISLVAEYHHEVAGYINVYIDAKLGALAGKGYCGIVDFGVLQKFRNRGIGGKLMDAAEKIAAGYADTVYLAVGLYGGYGSAQRMYFKRGYIPDGSGVWYKDKPAKAGENYPLDDDLLLYMSKKLK